MKDTKLKDIIGDDETYQNLIGLYRSLHGKENLEKRLLLKSMVYASLYPKSYMNVKWLPIGNFFHPNKETRFTMHKFQYWYEGFKYDTLYMYGHNLRNIFGYLI